MLSSGNQIQLDFFVTAVKKASPTLAGKNQDYLCVWVRQEGVNICIVLRF